jgi:hypothetical protein
LTLEDRLLSLGDVHLNNLFQLESGTWRCNVRNEAGLYEYGDGSTPSAALEQAVLHVTEGRAVPAIKNRPRALKEMSNVKIDLDLLDSKMDVNLDLLEL